MLGTLGKALGGPFLIPLALLGVVAWSVKHLFDLAASRRQHRRDFMDAWDLAKCDDDMRLEIVVRHLIGEYIPAPVIRAALEAGYPSRTLLDLEASWPKLRFDPDPGELVVQPAYLGSQLVRGALRVFWAIAYVACAVAAWQLATWAASMGSAEPRAWLAWFGAASLAIMALACLGKGDSLKKLAQTGLPTIARLNLVLARGREGGRPPVATPDAGLAPRDEPLAGSLVEHRIRSRCQSAPPSPLVELELHR